MNAHPIMQQPNDKKLYFFVDESGDPYFYNRNGELILGNDGCSKILMLGFIKTADPGLVRSRIRELQKNIENDPYIRNIPSVKKSILSFHATDDVPEIRERVYKTIIDLPIKAEFIVARKIESVFSRRHKKNPNLFYDDLISKLFQNQLHRTQQNSIYFSVRSNRARQLPLEQAIQASILAFEEKWKVKVDSEISIFPQRPESEPCLQVIDYMNWAVQRAFIKKEMRYFHFIKEKISLVIDIYDFKKYPKTYYNKSNQFDVNKISPL